MVGCGSGRMVVAAVTATVFAVACGGGGSDGGETQSLPNPPPAAEFRVGQLEGPEGLCFDSVGNLYIGSTTGRITRVAPDGSRTIFAETGRSLAGLATGPQDEIFAAAFNTGEVLAVSQDGVIRVATFGLDGPNGIVFDDRQRALVSALGLGGDPQVAIIQPDTTYQTLTTLIPSPNGMAFGPDGQLYVADTFMNRIVRLEIDGPGQAGTTPEVYASGIGLPDGIAFDEQGNLYVAGDGIIVVITAGDLNFISYGTTGAIDYPASLAFLIAENGRPENTLYFTNYGFPLGSGTTVSSIFTGIRGQQLNAPIRPN
jgi:sugar lactone lactonase YvrE